MGSSFRILVAAKSLRPIPTNGNYFCCCCCRLFTHAACTSNPLQVNEPSASCRQTLSFVNCMSVTQLRGSTRWVAGEVTRFAHPVNRNIMSKMLASGFMEPKLTPLKMECSKYLRHQMTLVTHCQAKPNFDPRVRCDKFIMRPADYARHIRAASRTHQDQGEHTTRLTLHDPLRAQDHAQVI